MPVLTNKVSEKQNSVIEEEERKEEIFVENEYDETLDIEVLDEILDFDKISVD